MSDNKCRYCNRFFIFPIIREHHESRCLANPKNEEYFIEKTKGFESVSFEEYQKHLEKKIND